MIKEITEEKITELEKKKASDLGIKLLASGKIIWGEKRSSYC